MTTPLTTKRELVGDIVNGASGGVRVAVIHDESRPGELLWELTYATWPDNKVREWVALEALRNVLRKDDSLVHQGRLTFIVSGEMNARLYVGAFFPHQAHLVTGLSKEALEEFCDNVS